MMMRQARELCQTPVSTLACFLQLDALSNVSHFTKWVQWEFSFCSTSTSEVTKYLCRTRLSRLSGTLYWGLRKLERSGSGAYMSCPSEKSERGREMLGKGTSWASSSSSWPSPTFVSHAGIGWAVWPKLANWRAALSSTLIWHGFYGCVLFLTPTTSQDTLSVFYMSPIQMSFKCHQNMCLLHVTSTNHERLLHSFHLTSPLTRQWLTQGYSTRHMSKVPLSKTDT